MITWHRIRRTRRPGRARARALAALLAASCAAPAVQPGATDESLRRVAAVARHDVFDEPVSLAPLLADRAVLYFFRTGCEHCAADLAAAPAFAARSGAAPLILISRESPARLRAALGPSPRRGLIVLSDSDGHIMDGALPTRFVPRVVVAERGRVRLDVTGEKKGGLTRAAAVLGRAAP